MIIEQVAPLTEQVCFHLMGDPLTHPKLADFVKICDEFLVKIFFVTNGVLLNKKNSQLILHPAFRQVNFSLHSFNDNFPDRNPTEYLKKIFAFCDQALLQRPDLYINFRLWNLLEPRGAQDRNQDMLARISDHFQIMIDKKIDVRSKKSTHIKNRLYMHYDTEFVWPSLDLPILGTKGTCYGLSSHFGILVDGTIVPCCLDKEGAIPLGKIQEQSLLSILDNTRSKALLDGFRKQTLAEDLCRRCQYIDRFKRVPRDSKPAR